MKMQFVFLKTAKLKPFGRMGRSRHSSLMAPSTPERWCGKKPRWEFIVPGLEGREAREVLELVYMKLKTEVLPEAERLVGKLPSVIE